MSNPLKNLRTGPVDILIITGAVVNLLVIVAILLYYFLGR